MEVAAETLRTPGVVTGLAVRLGGVAGPVPRDQGTGLPRAVGTPALLGPPPIGPVVGRPPAARPALDKVADVPALATVPPAPVVAPLLVDLSVAAFRAVPRHTPHVVADVVRGPTRPSCRLCLFHFLLGEAVSDTRDCLSQKNIFRGVRPRRTFRPLKRCVFAPCAIRFTCFLRGFLAHLFYFFFLC